MNLILPIASAAQTRAGMWRLLARRRGRLLLTVAVLLAGAVAALATPALLGVMIDVVMGSGEVSDLAWAGAALLVTGLASAALGYAGQTMLVTVCEGALADLREDVFDAALAQPVDRIEKAGTGDVVSRVSGDVEAAGEAISGVLPAVTSAVFTIAVTVVGLGVIDWRFAVAALVAAPVQIVSLRWFLGRSAPVYRQVRVAEAARTEQIIESVSSASTVVSLGVSEHHTDLVDSASRRAIGLSIDGINLLTRFYNRLNLAELIGLAAVLGTGFWLVTTGQVSVGAATAAALYFHRLFDPIGLVLGEFDELQKAAAGLSRLFGLTLATATSPAPAADAPTTTAPTTPDRSVAVTDVTHSYGDRLTLDAVSLHVAPGEHVAVVGASGAGKTTLAKIVLGLLAPSGGAVQVAGVDVVDQGAAGLRGRVAMVSQEVHVFSGTLAEDLRLAAPDVDDAALAEVLDRVGASWAATLPDGLSTVVGAGGHSLTADQAQQLALARLILADPGVVILDEATAEAGTGSARALDAAARVALAGRTAIVIAHRLTQAATADRVVVMAGGAVVETGTHEELLAARGPYARLWTAWSHHLT